MEKAQIYEPLPQMLDEPQKSSNPIAKKRMSRVERKSKRKPVIKILDPETGKMTYLEGNRAMSPSPYSKDIFAADLSTWVARGMMLEKDWQAEPMESTYMQPTHASQGWRSMKRQNSAERSRVTYFSILQDSNARSYRTKAMKRPVK